MDTERDEYFSRQDEDEYGQWLEELDDGKILEDYLNALCLYYGNRDEPYGRH